MELLIPHDFVQLDNLVDLVFLENDNSEVSIEETRSYTDIPELPDKNLLTGKFVNEAMRNLSNSGYVFSEQQLECMMSKEWSNKVLKLNYPFFKFYNPSDIKGHYIRNVQRYYANTFSFGNVTVYITKEWYPKNKKPFIEWYESLTYTL